MRAEEIEVGKVYETPDGKLRHVEQIYVLRPHYGTTNVQMVRYATNGKRGRTYLDTFANRAVRAVPQPDREETGG